MIPASSSASWKSDVSSIPSTGKQTNQYQSINQSNNIDQFNKINRKPKTLKPVNVMFHPHLLIETGNKLSSVH